MLNPHIGILVPLSVAVLPLFPAALFIPPPNAHFKKKDFDGTVLGRPLDWAAIQLRSNARIEKNSLPLSWVTSAWG
jgi:hypothetical protein